jgi:hypothetical protein
MAENKTDFDIIIAGGGPAGLSAAAELSKNFKVLLIEKNVLGTTFASWYSYEDRIKTHNLEDAVAFRSKFLQFVAPSLEHKMYDDVVVLDHEKTLNIWAERAKVNGAKFVQAEFLDYSRKAQDFVVVKTTAGNFSAKLLIDSCGAPSPIIKKRPKMVKRVDAWVIYGAKIRVKNNQRPAQIEYYPLNDEDNTYIGVHPFDEEILNFYVFIGKSGTFGDPSKLKHRFESTLAKTYPDAEIIAPLHGTIPSGILKKYALDNVIFWGASGMLNPDGCGMGFNEILRQLPNFTAGITRTFNAHRFDRRALGRVAWGLNDIETRNFQRIIGAFSLYFIKSKGKWDGGVKWLNAMGPDSKYWMRNEMSLIWIRDATVRLHRAVPFKETVKMIPFNELFFIIEQLIRFTVSAVVVTILRFFGFMKK